MTAGRRRIGIAMLQTLLFVGWSAVIIPITLSSPSEGMPFPLEVFPLVWLGFIAFGQAAVSVHVFMEGGQ